ncbi:MAG: tetratricopeptide repeat protein [Rhodospirillaceae bacterium]|nr:tetratricopeptide repeat protein [Rhodospirillaceae bacterium]
MNITRDMAALFEQGAAAFTAGHYAQAVEILNAVLARAPGFAPGHNLLGLALAGLGCIPEALSRYEAALRIDPSFAAPYINRATLWRDLGDPRAALADLDKAVALDPDDPTGHANRGSLLTEMGQPAAAIASLDRARALAPDYPYVAGLRMINKAYVCDWNGIEEDLAELTAKIQGGAPAAQPWALLALIDSPALQRVAAQAWQAVKAPENRSLGPVAKYPRHERIRLGYYCADFHRHPTGHLIAGLFERHHRGAFEVIAFSLRPVRDDDMHRRIVAGVDRFIDVAGRSDKEIAALSRELEIDIAIDLNGLIANNRVGVFAHRAAPAQVSYLAYPGTMGAPYMDYLIADDTVISDPAFYTERVIALPDCYQVNDAERPVSDRRFTRAELGLPAAGVVFCCFNNNFKITPRMFDIWMRILRAVDGSVLWLIEDSAAAAANLRREAARRGIAEGRLVFAPRMPQEEHLARQALADLFLDTLPYNAHTTGSDALWVGLPVITHAGKSFAARVGASLLKAMDLPELIAPTLADYEALAIGLAKDPVRLAEIRRKVMLHRTASRLFDLDRFTVNIEAAYTHIVKQGASRNPVGTAQ